MPLQHPALLAASVDTTLRLHHARTMARDPDALKQPYLDFVAKAQPERSAEDAAAAFRTTVLPRLLSITIKANGETLHAAGWQAGWKGGLRIEQRRACAQRWAPTGAPCSRWPWASAAGASAAPPSWQVSCNVLVLLLLLLASRAALREGTHPVPVPHREAE